MDDGGSWDPLIGREVHGFTTFQDLNFGKLIEEASSRWFRPNEIYAILANYTRFKVQPQPVEKPTSGTVVLYDRKVVRNFRKDGHSWKKKKDGKSVQEAHEKLKIGNKERVHVYYAHGDDDPNSFRRCYWLLDKEMEHIVLVHYRQTSEDVAAVAPRNIENEGTIVVPSIRMVDHSPLDSGNSTSAPDHSETSCSVVVAKETNSQVGAAMQTEPQISHEEEINKYWEELYESSLLPDDDSREYGVSPSNQQSEHQSQKSINITTSASPLSNSISFLLHNTSVESSTNNSGLNYALGKHIHAAKNQQHHSQPFETSIPDSQTGGFKLNAPGSTTALVNLDNDAVGRQDGSAVWNYLNENTPVLSDNQSSDALTLMDQSKEIFNITEMSPHWAYSMEETKVIVVGYFSEQYKHLATATVYCVFGDTIVAAEKVQAGVYRCMTLRQEPGAVNFYMTSDGCTPISQVLSFEYRSKPGAASNSNMTSAEDDKKSLKLPLQIRLAQLLFSTTNKKATPKLHTEISRAAALASQSMEKEWMDLRKLASDSEASFVPATENFLELILRNKLQEWLTEKVVEGSKVTSQDDLGQGAIHLCAVLDYTWAIRLFSLSGFSLDYRDASGWTALHWASYCGKEKMVATLLSAGANASLITDPTPDSPGGFTAADLAAQQGYEGLAAFLAERGLAAHFEAMSLSGNIQSAPTTSAQTTKFQNENFENLSEQELCLRESLAAYRNAANAANHIQAALRERALKLQTKVAQSEHSEIEASVITATLKIQSAYRNYNRRKKMRAAARIQSTYLTWKARRRFLNMRNQAIKIQAAFRGHQVRKQLRKMLWSVGVLEKAVLRWRRRRKGLRGIKVELSVMNTDIDSASTGEEEFFRVSRQQAEERFDRSVVRVQALFRSYRAQQEYRRMKMAHEQAKMEFDQQGQHM